MFYYSRFLNYWIALCLREPTSTNNTFNTEPAFSTDGDNNRNSTNVP